MKKFTVEVTTYNVVERNGKIKHEADSTKHKTTYFKNKEIAKKFIQYLNRSSINTNNRIKKYALKGGAK